MNCQGCGAARNKLKIIQSQTLRNKKFNMCSDCISNKIEPRWAIILSARSFGIDHVLDLVNNRQYKGADISVHDIYS